MNREVRYIEVPPGEASRPEREAAAGAVSWAAADLEMPLPRIRWFLRCPPSAAEAWAGILNGIAPAPPEGAFEIDRPIRGYVSPQDPGTIWIHVGMGRVQTAATALHEACHVFQAALMGPAQGRLEFDGREQMAAAYSRDLRDVARAIASTTMEGARDG